MFHVEQREYKMNVKNCLFWGNECMLKTKEEGKITCLEFSHLYSFTPSPLPEYDFSVEFSLFTTNIGNFIILNFV